MPAPEHRRIQALLFIHRIMAAQAQHRVILDPQVQVHPPVVGQFQIGAPVVRQRDRQLVAQEQLRRYRLRIGRVGQHDGIELAARAVDLLRRPRRPAAPGQ
ncbi:hypothetical protein DDE05_20425, partial [Streptomyces cavourensis]